MKNFKLFSSKFNFVQGGVFVILFVLGFEGFSQNNSFLQLVDPTTVLTAEELQNFQTISNFPTTDDLKIVTLANLATYQSNGSISFTMPFENTSVSFKIQEVEFENEANFYWYGSRTTTTLAEKEDYLIFNSYQSVLSASLFVNQTNYRIIPISSRYHVIVKIKLIQRSGNSDNASSNGTSSNSSACTTMGSESCIIRLLIMYDPNIPLSSNSLVGVASLCASDIKTTMKRSQIKHKVQLVAVESFDDPWANLLKACDEATNLSNLIATPSSDVRTTIERFSSDVCILLTSGINYDSAIGCVRTIKPTVLEEACGVVMLSEAVNGSHTFAHETGHLFGGRHENDDDEPPAHAFVKHSNILNRNIFTMMHSEALSVILNFSNPNVNYMDVNTGTQDSFNACVIQQFGCTLAGVYSGTGGLCEYKLVVSPSGLICNPTELTLTVTTTDTDPACLSANNRYEFEMSFDGINYIPLTPVDYASNTYKLQVTQCQRSFFFRVTIRQGALGIIGRIFETVVNFCECEGVQTGNKIGSKNGFEQNNIQLKDENNQTKGIVPNPVGNNFVFFDKDNNGEEVEIKIVKADGTQVEKGKRVIPFEYNTNTLISGTYFLIVIYKNNSSILKFIKQ